MQGKTACPHAEDAASMQTGSAYPKLSRSRPTAHVCSSPCPHPAGQAIPRPADGLAGRLRWRRPGGRPLDDSASPAGDRPAGPIQPGRHKRYPTDPHHGPGRAHAVHHASIGTAPCANITPPPDDDHRACPSPTRTAQAVTNAAPTAQAFTDHTAIPAGRRDHAGPHAASPRHRIGSNRHERGYRHGRYRR